MRAKGEAVKITITVDLDKLARKAIGKHHGHDKPASREVCKRLIESLVASDIETIVQEYHEHNNKGS